MSHLIKLLHVQERKLLFPALAPQKKSPGNIEGGTSVALRSACSPNHSNIDLRRPRLESTELHFETLQHLRVARPSGQAPST